MRLATYNVQWFDHLFDADDRLRDDDGRGGREGVAAREQVEALGAVFRAIDADAVVVVEAPDARRGEGAVESFARRFGLRAREAVTGTPSGTQQEVSLLFDPGALRARLDPQAGGGVPRFDGAFRADPGGDGRPEPVRWSKPPLEVAVTTQGGASLRLIGVHAKSKNPHGARGEAAHARVSKENRRKQIGQCLWLRARVDAHLAAGDSLVVLGDFNDGPGQDEFEQAFGRSGVEVVLGEASAVRLLEPHARLAMGGPTGPHVSSARFRLPPRGDLPARWLSALLDYAMASPDLAAANPRWRIWHPFDDPECWGDQALRSALLHASDHFPVTLDLDL